MKRMVAFATLFLLLALACNTVNRPSPALPEVSTASPSEPELTTSPIEPELTEPPVEPGSTELPEAATAEPEVEPSASTEPEAVTTETPPQPAPTKAPVPAGELNPNPPEKPVRLVFVHHSSGGNWLANPADNGYGGDLGRALMENNYFVSATNYGWGPNSIGDRTDIGHWWDWFRGDRSATYLKALYRESKPNFGDFGAWPRLKTAPAGENEIVMFKSCFPNSAVEGRPGDPPRTGDNPLRGQDIGPETLTVANAKGIYADLLEYFAARPQTLFIVITAPPLHEAETSPEQAANARALNRWLAEDWLSNYALPNVAVFDLYNVLTSNGGSPDQNDVDSESGNHHRYRAGAIEYVVDQGGNTSAYAFAGDSHPTSAGNQKATAEFVPLLNIFYHRWRQGK